MASKTALALMAARPDENNRRLQAQGQLIRQGQVSPDTWVAYMSWHGGPIISTACGGAAARALSGPEREMYGVILTFAGVGVYVISFIDGLPSGAEIGGAPQPLRQCWPIQSPYLNRPPPTVDNRILPTLLSFGPLQTVRGR